MTEPNAVTKVLPIACTLTPTELRDRRAGLLEALLKAAEHSEVLPRGCRFRFAPTSETLTTIALTIDAERQCCRFLRFQLTVEPGVDSFHLDVTGPEGTAEFLGDLLQL